MKKRIMSIAIAIMLIATCAFVIPTTTHQNDCFAKAKTKYVKIKKTTYNNMKKTISNQKATIQKQSTAIQNQSKLIDQLNATIKDKKSTINWLWSTLEEFEYEYNYDTHKWEYTGEPEAPEELPWTELMYTEDVVPTMAEQTGLTIDNVQIIETYRNWACYYVEADGDLYVITMNKGIVDVCQILN